MLYLPLPQDADCSRTLSAGSVFPPFTSRDLYGTVSGRLYSQSREDAIQIIREAHRLARTFDAEMRLESAAEHVAHNLPVGVLNGGGSPHNSRGLSVAARVRAFVYAVIGCVLLMVSLVVLEGRAVSFGLFLLTVSVVAILRAHALSKRWG